MIFTLKKRDVNKGITMDITTLFFLWTKNALWDVIQWTLSFPFNLEFLTVDACLARYYKIMVSTPFLFTCVFMCTAYLNARNTFVISFPSKNSALTSMPEA